MTEAQGPRASGDVLERILETKREEAAALRGQASSLRRACAEVPPPRDLEAALRGEGSVSLIAEVKRRSPGAGSIRPELDPAQLSRGYQAAGAAAISVLTDGPWFGGSLADLAAVRDEVSIPVLRKDFTLEDEQVLEARAGGADGVLLIVRILDDTRLRGLRELAESLGMTALVEVHGHAELTRALGSGARVVGINNRDLADFSTSLETTFALLPAIPEHCVIVSESGIQTPADVARLGSEGVHAVLVGEALLRHEDPAVPARELAGRPRRERTGPDVRVKICGLMRTEDARHAARAGADYLGAILTEGFGRSVPAALAREFNQPGGPPLVAVFVDEPTGELVTKASQAGASVLQLHGEESPAVVDDLRREGSWDLWKAVRPRSAEELLRAADGYAERVDALLVDGWHENIPGGGGVRFRWEVLEEIRGQLPSGLALVIAGGLTPDTVAEAVARLTPDVVDVSSGVESVPRQKDPAKIEAFVRAARATSGAGRARA